MLLPIAYHLEQSITGASMVPLLASLVVSWSWTAISLSACLSIELHQTGLSSESSDVDSCNIEAGSIQICRDNHF